MYSEPPSHEAQKHAYRLGELRPGSDTGASTDLLPSEKTVLPHESHLHSQARKPAGHTEALLIGDH